MKDKRRGKLDKHFPILLNGHKVKILSYHIETQNGHQILVLKTLIQNPWLRPGLVGQTCCISIGTKEPLQNLRCHCYGASGRSSYYFYVMSEGDRISYGELISAEPTDYTKNS